MRFITSFGMTNKNKQIKKGNIMKKILFAIVIVLTICLTANAQGRDGFFNNSDNDNYNRGINDEGGLILPNAGGLVNGGEYGNDEPAPIGSGLLVLTALGAGYALYRKKGVTKM